MTRRGFFTGAAAALAGLGGWGWLRTRENEDGIPWPLRRVLRFDQSLSELLFDADRLSSTFSTSRIQTEPRENGTIGVGENFDPDAWRLHVESPGKADLSLKLDEIKSLPRVEMVTELKCIEGWSQIVQWAGVPLRDFASHYRRGTHSGAALNTKKLEDVLRYVSLETPDGGYYVGLDAASALHPQTLLCYDMNGEPLPLKHGGPLRLVIPVKYGIKNLKRIGTIRFTDERPSDYWAERGYDWYAGH